MLDFDLVVVVVLSQLLGGQDCILCLVRQSVLIHAFNLFQRGLHPQTPPQNALLTRNIATRPTVVPSVELRILVSPALPRLRAVAALLVAQYRADTPDFFQRPVLPHYGQLHARLHSLVDGVVNCVFDGAQVFAATEETLGHILRGDIATG